MSNMMKNIFTKEGSLESLWEVAEEDRKLKKAQIWQYHIAKLIEGIIADQEWKDLKPREKNILLLGFERILRRKLHYVSLDCNLLLSQLTHPNMKGQYKQNKRRETEPNMSQGVSVTSRKQGDQEKIGNQGNFENQPNVENSGKLQKLKVQEYERENPRGQKYVGGKAINMIKGATSTFSYNAEQWPDLKLNYEDLLAKPINTPTEIEQSRHGDIMVSSPNISISGGTPGMQTPRTPFTNQRTILSSPGSSLLDSRYSRLSTSLSDLKLSPLDHYQSNFIDDLGDDDDMMIQNFNSDYEMVDKIGILGENDHMGLKENGQGQGIRRKIGTKIKKRKVSVFDANISLRGRGDYQSQTSSVLFNLKDILLRITKRNITEGSFKQYIDKLKNRYLLDDTPKTPGELSIISMSESDYNPSANDFVDDVIDEIDMVMGERPEEFKFGLPILEDNKEEIGSVLLMITEILKVKSELSFAELFPLNVPSITRKNVSEGFMDILAYASKGIINATMVGDELVIRSL